MGDGCACRGRVGHFKTAGAGARRDKLWTAPPQHAVLASRGTGSELCGEVARAAQGGPVQKCKSLARIISHLAGS